MTLKTDDTDVWNANRRTAERIYSGSINEKQGNLQDTGEQEVLWGHEFMELT